MGANGNTLIARNTIEAISRLLDKGMSGEEILCIVEWSGTNRHQFFIDRQSTNAGSAELFQYDTGVTYENGKDIPYISYENLAKQKRNGCWFLGSI